MSSSATATALVPPSDESSTESTSSVQSIQPIRYCDPAQTPYIIADLFPVRRVHLLVGPSGAGKTRWLFPMISDWLASKQIFERNSYPLPCGYLACDRPAEAAKETLSALALPNMSPDNFPIKSMMDLDKEFHYDCLPTMFSPHVRVIFVEALAALLPNGKINDYHSVLKFFKALYKICTRSNLTIIGSVHQPKMREDESFSHPRDKVLGSVAWAACSDTVILIEPDNPRNTQSTRRRMTVLPRNESHFEYTLDFNDLGHLLPIGGDAASYAFLMEQELTKLSFDDSIETASIHEWGAKHAIPRRTVEFWIKSQLELGTIERIRKGVYKRIRSN
jgi:hypothetical protein